ncbi:hypothetical protein Tco_1363395 [Tanacetum coccineum]
MLVDLINQRKKLFAQQRAEAKRNKSMTQAQQRTYMSNYIKNQEGDMLKRFDRDDLEKLWDLVKKKFSSTESTVDKEKELWVELKRLFQMYMHDPLVWKLYDTCGVHHVSSPKGHDIFMLIEKDYPLTRGLITVMLANKLQVDESSEMANELLRKIFYQANRPRQ